MSARPKPRLHNGPLAWAFAAGTTFGPALAQWLPLHVHMRIAIPHWQGRVSPVFDVADDLLLVDIERAAESYREQRTLVSVDPFHRAAEVAGFGTDVLICGAISLVLETALNTAGVRVFGFICGSVEEIVGAWLTGGLGNPRFYMPGRCTKRRRQCFRHGPETGNC